MNRFEGTGLAVAIGAHVVLVGLLLIGARMMPPPVLPRNEPIEVSLSDEVGLKSEAPVVSHEKLAAKLSPVEAPVEPDSAPAEPEPAPEPKPAAKPKPAPVKPAPAPEAKPVQPQPSSNNSPRRRPDRPVAATGNLDGILNGTSNNHTTSTSTTPPAAVIGEAVKSSLKAELYRVLKPHWRAPTGADADKLRTTVRAELNPDGTIKGTPQVIRQEGVTDSNRAQAELHKERAIKAVLLAAPYSTFPAKFYEGWKVISPTFDWKMSQ